jgi:F-type H+-transporting ATPase subunit epsilon
MANLHVTVITPARAVFDADAKAVVAPAFDGELGVLPGHASMLALLGTGELRVTTPEGGTRKLAIRGGFLQVNNDKITVLTPESVAPEDIKPDTLSAEAQKLDAEKVTKLEDREAQEVRRGWLKARQKIVSK